MQVTIDFAGIEGQFRAALDEGRDYLFEYEVYDLLSASGAETPPRTILVPKDARAPLEEIAAFPGEKVVLKIVSPAIIHKTEAGGVRIVRKEADDIRSGIRRMLYEVPENFAALIETDTNHAPEAYKGLGGGELREAVRRDIKGVLAVQFMPPDSSAFGNELIVGLRNTREFGPVISAGLGGTDTELYAARFRKGQAIIAASCELTDGKRFFERFRTTIAYKKLAGLTRGQRRIVTDEQLEECFASFISMGRRYSAANPDAPFVIEEMEINPFAFTNYLMVPLDGMCRFSLPGARTPTRPIRKIGNLLHPGSIGIIGASATRRNFGRIILENVMAEGYDPQKIRLIRPVNAPGERDAESGVLCVPDLASLPEKLDLLVVAIGAENVPQLVDELIDRDAANAVMLIPGGMGETEESAERARRVVARIEEAHGAGAAEAPNGGGGGPVFLGANCMGVVSHPGSYDTWFIPEAKLPKDRSSPYHRAAFISQSGAFMLHRSSAGPELNPAYMVSMGNQTDLTLGDMVRYFADSDTVDVIAVYAEGFKDLDGLAFCGAVRRAVLAGKDVVFYKAGRTPEGKNATSGHTASMAGDYMVCESCVRQAGAMVASSFTEFSDLFLLAERVGRKAVGGNRLAAASGAGFEAVGMADSIHSDEYQLRLAAFGEDSRTRIRRILEEKKLAALVTVANPLDMNPSADDDVHAAVADILLADPGVDALIMGTDPLSPVTRTLDADGPFCLADPEALAQRLGVVAAKHDKPMAAVVDGGKRFDALREALLARGIPVFPLCDRAVAAMAKYIEARLLAGR